MAVRLKAFLLLVLGLAAGLSAWRLAFYIEYSALFNNDSFWEILLAFLKGIRFDLSTAAIMNAPFTLMLFLPGLAKNRKYLIGLLAGAGLWHVVLLGYNTADIIYYRFAQRHLTFELGNAAGDIGVVMELAFKTWGVEILVFSALLAVYYILFLGGADLATRSQKDNRLKLPDHRDFVSVPATFVAVILLSVVMVRGGLQMKPLGIKNAFQSEKVQLGILSLNGVYTTWDTVYRARKHGQTAEYLNAVAVSEEERREFIGTVRDTGRETITPEYPFHRAFKYRDEERLPMNVVIFVMESWSGKFSRAMGGPVDATPNFDQLSQRGTLAVNGFANAQRSMEGLAAIVGSLPVWKGMALGQGGLVYQTGFTPLGDVFQDLGYRTMFIHAARPGSMGFDGLMTRLGFSERISRDDFELTDENNDGVWGVYDEFTFLRANREFAGSEKPFLAVVYSLSSHSPYTFPERDFEKFPETAEHYKFLNSLKYSDWALGRFFEAAKEEEYFYNTLFVVVGDHTEGASTGGSMYESYRVPIFFYAPGVVEAERVERPVSQLDIVPTIMDALRINLPFTSWGKSLYSEGGRRFVLPRGNLFVFQERGKLLLSDFEKPMALYGIGEDPNRNLLGERREMAEELLTDLQAYVKTTYNIMAANRVKPHKDISR